MDPLDILFRAIEVLITAALVFYAYATIKEARNDRKKNTIERMLENLYSPLREILTRARFDIADERNRMRLEKGPRDYAFSEHELRQVQGIIEGFGHYLDLNELLKLRKDLQKYDAPIPEYDTSKGPVTWYRFLDNDLDPHREHIEKKCESLIKELQKLTGASKT